ncbi:transglycosylase SLT domain-containing protein [Mongoliitalea daihaiensis]|uniref:transglycosylase SLT domain-containing protein n=1 Tax=Mongoliitalea daihaiensis TaxID=2782006 RepID=UPI001F28F1A2|nr:transglycosylase SLT domain-containing protein [Mongoliitalea daihaiensis]UJP63322.1 transglycosylase SLT domain-containing protein [Mongoliitalea daihaiensis]
MKTSLFFFVLTWMIVVISGKDSLHAQELYGINETAIQEQLLQAVYNYDYIPDFTYEQVEKRVRKMETSMSFELNERIFSFINYFVVRNRDYTRMVMQRKYTYFPLFEKTLEEHDMPDDIKYLAIIESGLNPKAKSRVGAMGLWQFMPATGRMYNLHVNRDIDDRMDPDMSTEAAAKYLKSLYRMFGDWELALAAYNCGPGNVRKAISRSGGKRTFWEIYNWLPKETRGYVPQFQAMMYIFRYADEHNIILENPTFPIAYDRIKFNQEIDLEQLAQLADICLSDLEYLNPSIQNKLIPSSNQHMAVRVPKTKSTYIAENKSLFKEAIELQPERAVALRTSSSTGANTITNNSATAGKERIAYKVRSGDVLGKIASNHGTSVQNIKNWNNLNSNTIRVGQTLYIYTNQSSSPTLADNSPSGNPKVYTVQPGDSLWTISKKSSGLSVEQIKQLNNLQNTNIKPGQKLIIG